MQKLNWITERIAFLGLSAIFLTGSVTGSSDIVPIELFSTQEELEVTVWAQSPMFFNPTNIDIDRDGRIWVAEGVNYRRNFDRHTDGDRIVILEDTDGDGQADSSRVFVQEPFLRCPMGVAVIDNKIVVSMAPNLMVYTDVNRDLKFDPGIDTREVLLTGFNGRIHDHSLHSVTVGPDGRWYWNSGNCGAVFTDKSGQTFRVGSSYNPGNPFGGRKGFGMPWNPTQIAGQKSDDGHVYVGGFSARMNPDGSMVQIIGQNFRNSYEQTVTSFGDVFQNDNDDPPACRTAFLMEYGNAGFSSFDGQRSWKADRRPGQSTPIAEWRQEDPGTMPPGDVYGGGAPTGIAYYENGALGSRFEGMLLSCEPARNVVFGYFPKPEGAGYKLERFDFITSNQDKEFAGTDFKGGKLSKETKTLFRPSDVAVGPDGAIYVSDWYDPRVGGHGDYDNTLSGAIYRIAPKDFKPVIPQFDLTTVDGQIKALKSPSVNVRNLGATALRAGGKASLEAVKNLLSHEKPYFAARAIWILADLGEPGTAEVEKLLAHDDAMIRVAAYRALRHKNHNLISMSERMSKDPSSAVRREVALAMRDIPFDQSRNILLNLSKGYDGEDRSYLEAFGTGCTGKESQVYDSMVSASDNEDPIQWSRAFAGIAWRLHPKQSTPGFSTRVLSESLTEISRKASLTALAYIGSREAVNTILTVAEQTTDPVSNEAVWWLLNRKDGAWQDYGVNAELKKRGIYDPDQIQLMSLTTPKPTKSQLPPVSEILKLKGDPVQGKLISAACYMCHKIEGIGIDVGPELTGWAKTQTSEIVLTSIIDPSADIAHGYNAYEIKTTDGITIDGLIVSNSDPVVIISQGGVTQMIPKNRIKSQKRLRRSLMLGAEQLGLGNPQYLADLLAYLKSI
ncbi:MAG TPA: dehydrogenase [Verrucomicrobiales bacterium]|nr:dehydrogenase [Verrucomicrobiales bacterium]